MRIFDMEDRRDTEEIDMTEVNPNDPYEGMETEKEGWIKQEGDKRETLTSYMNDEQYRAHHTRKMLALLFWFVVLSVIAILGALVYKVVIWIV